ncbi:short-chain dehydrogenase [Ornithinimicrobium pekingense]|uniref:Short-chain dehydrogenase n=2 Tax=Ornithinimicrobium pekingense TaxID=384677 RepID=A0ABQ2F779_9MICO|nr:short-chain dehydrogenase [Ornithinimicrobium pekingense]
MGDRRRVLVTGATGGIGYFVAEQLARKGHRVVLAARSAERAEAATAIIQRLVPGADLEVVLLDLADLGSVAAAAERLAAGEPLATLVANAACVSYGLRREPPRVTADGLELHLGTAYLGHYALLARLLPRLQAWGTRIVHVGSLGARLPVGRSPWDRLTTPRPEAPLRSYARSKAGVTLLHHELARRLTGTSAASSVLAHPGTAVDVLTPGRHGIPASQPTEIGALSRLLVRGMHGKHDGAAVLVHAATDPEVRNGEVWGPAGRWQVSGPPARVHLPVPRRAGPLTRELLAVSEEVTGLALRFGPGGSPGQPWPPRSTAKAS